MAENSTPAAFDALVEVYDSLIDWPKRLANEEPFFKRMFAEASARRVLDAACGTGHHAAMFHRWGMAVEGIDLSAAMIARCKERFGDNERLRWTVRSFEDAGEHRERFDALKGKRKCYWHWASHADTEIANPEHPSAYRATFDWSAARTIVASVNSASIGLVTLL